MFGNRLKNWNLEKLKLENILDLTKNIQLNAKTLSYVKTMALFVFFFKTKEAVVRMCPFIPCFYGSVLISLTLFHVLSLTYYPF